MKKVWERKQWAGFFAAAILMLALLAQTAQATEYWKGKFVRFYATAGESLAIGDVVCIESNDCRAYKANASLASSRKVAVGVVGTAAAAGASVEIVVSGIITGQTAASAGSRVYVGTTAGEMTTANAANWGQGIGTVVEGTAAESAKQESTTYFISVLPVAASQ